MLDLSTSPYDEYAALLDALRREEKAWERVAFSEAKGEERGTYDENERERARVVQLLFLSAAGDDLKLVRFLLSQEIKARRADSFQGAGDTLTMLSILLLGYADLADVPMFWAAKSANFDTWAGGFDMEFVLAAGGRDEVLQRLGSIPDALESLEKYDLQEIYAGLSDWGASLVERYPRSLDEMEPDGLEQMAELFGDRINLERLGLMNAETPTARGHLFRRIGEFGKAHTEWLEAAKSAESPWDTVSCLTSAMADAAKAGIETVEEAREIDRLRPRIESWRAVGLGRMATTACFELATSAREPSVGTELWAHGQKWVRELDSFPLVGLRAALAAAGKWGSADDVAALEQGIRDEEARIQAMLGSR